MKTTQTHLLIKDIKEDIVLLRNGGGALVLGVSAVNFGLLSDREQIAIISAFAQMLNSLSFAIQIVIRSERLNISSYLSLLDKAQKAQTNQLLSKMIVSYRQFIQSTIKENEVLDKQFFVVVPLYALELGLLASRENLEQKIKTVLLPRRDQIIRQLARVGLLAKQLNNRELLELFYDVYNGEAFEKAPEIKATHIDVNLKEPQKATSTYINDQKSSAIPQPQPPANLPPLSGQTSKNHPFVVEELEDT